MSDMTQILTITDAALAKILEVRADEPEPANQALWVEISGVSGAAYTYDMYFRAVGDVGQGDHRSAAARAIVMSIDTTRPVALLTVSSNSFSGTLSATIPAPDCTWAVPPAMTTVRRAMQVSMLPL